MLITTSISEAKSVNADEVWLIVRSLKKQIELDVPVIQVQSLSPSPELFHKYLKWKEDGLWGRETFEEYRKEFLRQMKQPESVAVLKKLRKESKEKNIAIACFCSDESLCHRSIVKELVESMDDTFSLLVAGSRNFSDYEMLKKSLDFFLQNKNNIEIVSGGARGADKLAELYAEERGYDLKVFKADWDKYGKSAGYRRNSEMMEYLKTKDDAGVVCFWDGNSKGTKHMIDLSKRNNIPIRIKIV